MQVAEASLVCARSDIMDGLKFETGELRQVKMEFGIPDISSSLLHSYLGGGATLGRPR